MYRKPKQLRLLCREMKAFVKRENSNSLFDFVQMSLLRKMGAQIKIFI